MEDKVHALLVSYQRLGKFHSYDGSLSGMPQERIGLMTLTLSLNILSRKFKVLVNIWQIVLVTAKRNRACL